MTRVILDGCGCCARDVDVQEVVADVDVPMVTDCCEAPGDGAPDGHHYPWCEKVRTADQDGFDEYGAATPTDLAALLDDQDFYARGGDGFDENLRDERGTV